MRFRASCEVKLLLTLSISGRPAGTTQVSDSAPQLPQVPTVPPGPEMEEEGRQRAEIC